MTLDSAITYYEEIAKECRRKAGIERNDYMDMRDSASEAEQLASWLNELKLLRGRIDAQQRPRWIPCGERLPEEDRCLGGSGRQFSDEVLVSVANYDDEDIWTYISQTIDGEWALELPSHCEIIAWMPLPEPYTERRGK